VIIAIGETSQVGEARRAAAEFARKGGANDIQLGRVAIIATELATNIVKHAAGGGGMLIVERYSASEGTGIELMAVDKGPGMADVKASRADGFSTAGSPGTGLGAIERQADRFGVYSWPALGTVVLARVAFGDSAAIPPNTDIGLVAVPYPGETVSGDKWAFGAGSRGHTLFVVDGSGHGPDAARAAETATKIFDAYGSEDCVPLVERIHRGLAPTRGAALAVARIDAAEKLIRFVGIGNITGALLTGVESRQMVSHNGTAGHIAPRIREFVYPFSGMPCIIMHSDGLSNRWRLADYPGLAAAHPSLIAAMLFRDFRRGRDDATIAVMRVR
jgi:anti-sigma regulatory factor (Ser/Thr protein kinase)